MRGSRRRRRRAWVVSDCWRGPRRGAVEVMRTRRKQSIRTHGNGQKKAPRGTPQAHGSPQVLVRVPEVLGRARRARPPEDEGLEELSPGNGRDAGDDVALQSALGRHGALQAPPVWKSKFTARSSSTPSTRRLLDGVAMPVPHRSAEPGRPRHRREKLQPTHWLISTQGATG